MDILTLKMLAKAEREMDSGTLPFVIYNGNRNPFPQEVLDEFDIKSGQTVNPFLMQALVDKIMTQLELDLTLDKLKRKA